MSLKKDRTYWQRKTYWLIGSRGKESSRQLYGYRGSGGRDGDLDPDAFVR